MDRKEWFTTMDSFAISWREPLTAEDIDDIEAMAALCIRGMRRRNIPARVAHDEDAVRERILEEYAEKAETEVPIPETT